MAFTYMNIWTFLSLFWHCLSQLPQPQCIHVTRVVLSLQCSTTQSTGPPTRSQLGLRRQGCRAGRRRHRQLMMARSVAASANCVGTPGEIPTIIGHRYEEVNNSDQLINRHGARPRVIIPVCTGYQQSSLASPTPQLSSTSLTHTTPSIYVINAAALSKLFDGVRLITITLIWLPSLRLTSRLNTVTVL